jgi:hypothetical protein
MSDSRANHTLLFTTKTAWANGNFKLMQMQVEAAKKRQSLTKNKPAFVPKVEQKTKKLNY